ncbi:MAG: high-affinity branched-chain amino acid ABC transporter ATP-binding protein LivG [Candidatus Riflebacteria bacterium RBG_13_59_9]|nr:MAG: high-affinity branched-chain amino acid ABC transporter ATP-binding protein LivG [Candidatus Riflebacteria bacterium RBG_13_59_9]
MLRLENITVSFGGLCAVKDLSLEVLPRRIIGLIGPNGAGKTTVFNAITGVYRPQSGNVYLDGRAITHLPTHAITRLGIGRTFQNIRLFKNMSVLDNLKVALHQNYRYSLLEAFFRVGRTRFTERLIDEEAMRILHFFGLAETASRLAGGLPYGQQKYLEIARAYATHPKVLLLDEPAAGLNETEIQELMKRVHLTMEQTGAGVLLIEHRMRVVMGICENIHVLDHGLKIAEGTPDEIRDNPRVIEAYLGEEVKG